MSDAPLKIACRFIAFDQWLVTHVSRDWTIRQVKAHILAKCFSLETSAEQPPSLRRPPSPITFAPNPRPQHKLISPITFAPRQSPYNSDDDVTGYEEDDELDPNDAELNPIMPENTKQRFINPARVPNQRKMKLQKCHAPESYTVLRFCTGQVLEDDFKISWYELCANELLEVHRTGFILTLPRHNISTYGEPYFEGLVKALRVVNKPSRSEEDPFFGDFAKSKKKDKDRSGKRTDSRDTKVEWRSRWIVIREGVLYLCKSATEDPTQELPISSLLALHGADHLSQMNHPARMASASSTNRKIICAKFRPRPQPPMHISVASRSSSNPSNPPSPKQSRPSRSLIAKSSFSSSPSAKHFSRESSPLPNDPPRTLMITPLPSSVARKPSRASMLRGKQFNRGYSEERDDGPSKMTSTLRKAASPKRSRALPMFSGEEDSADGNASDDSGNLSSPVFAHSDDVVSDEDDSWNDDERTSMSHQSTFPSASSSARSDAPLSESKDPPQEKGEWVVFDISDDTAFTSLLRVLHRLAGPDVTSTWIPVNTQFSKQSPTTPFSSPITPTASTVLSTTTSSSSKPAPPKLTTKNLDISPITGDSPLSMPLSHPNSLASFVHSPITRTGINTFGALPFPEWRRAMTEQAMRAGVGGGGAGRLWFFCRANEERINEYKQVDVVQMDRERGRARDRERDRESPTDTLRHYVTAPSPTKTVGARDAEVGAGAAEDDSSSITTSSSSSGEVSPHSDMEWVGWMSDLRRKAMPPPKASSPTPTGEEEETQTQNLPLSPRSTQRQSTSFFSSGIGIDGADLKPTMSQARRKAFEPSATVMSLSPRQGSTSPPAPLSPTTTSSSGGFGNARGRTSLSVTTSSYSVSPSSTVTSGTNSFGHIYTPSTSVPSGRSTSTSEASTSKRQPHHQHSRTLSSSASAGSSSLYGSGPDKSPESAQYAFASTSSGATSPMSPSSPVDKFVSSSHQHHHGPSMSYDEESSQYPRERERDREREKAQNYADARSAAEGSGSGSQRNRTQSHVRKKPSLPAIATSWKHIMNGGSQFPAG